MIMEHSWDPTTDHCIRCGRSRGATYKACEVPGVPAVEDFSFIAKRWAELKAEWDKQLRETKAP